MKVGYCGMTHLGLVSAAATATKGVFVTAFDPNSERIGQLKSGLLPVKEPGLGELIEQEKDRIAFTADAGDLSSCDIVYVACDVPTDEKGASELSKVLELVDTARVSAPNSVHIILSQVPPGFARQLTHPALYYQVETLVFGNAVERAQHPERFIVGCSNPDKGLPSAYRNFLKLFDCPILTMAYESAELAKIAINCCLAASISVANTLAELSEKIGADWRHIAPALRLDRRIGPHAYLTPGLGIAGGNIERDLCTVIRMSEANGSDNGVIRSILSNSSHRRNWPFLKLHQHLLRDRSDVRIALWGLAYKPDTHSTKNSPAEAFLGALGPCPVRCFDPVVPTDGYPHLSAAAGPLQACEGADALVILTAWSMFASVSPNELASLMRGNLIIDPFHVLNSGACRDSGLRHVGLGVSDIHGHQAPAP